MFFFFTYPGSCSVDKNLSKVLRGEGLTWFQIEKMLHLTRETKPDISVGALHSFLFVVHKLAEDEQREVTVKDVAEGLRAPYATVARHCDVLCGGPKGSGGLNWLVKEPGTTPRTKSLKLTYNGHHFLSVVLLGDK
jgi:hypothetical protein